jgi:hypothetical protein
MASEGGPQPNIILQDHFGTQYRLKNSAILGSRNLQVFTPSVPPGTRSLTVRSADDTDRPVVTFAVPLMAVKDEPDVAAARRFPPEPELRRPA